MGEANPLRYDQSLPLCTGHNLLMTTLDIQKRAKELRMPIMICHGDNDCVTDCEHSKLFAKGCGCSEQDKTLRLYQGKGHLLYEEAPEVFEDSVEWMLQRVSQDGGGDQNVVSPDN